MVEKKTKTKSKTEKPKTKKEKVYKYSLDIDLNNEVNKFKTDDFLKTLTEFKESDKFPPIIKTRMVIKYSNGKVSREKVFYQAFDTKKLFENTLRLKLLADTLTKELG